MRKVDENRYSRPMVHVLAHPLGIDFNLNLPTAFLVYRCKGKRSDEGLSGEH